MADAKQEIEAWRVDDNERRPHSSLGHLTPNEHAQQTSELTDADVAENSAKLVQQYVARTELSWCGRGLEPPRYRYRQPLKLVELLCRPELTRIHLTEVAQERARANASDDLIRPNSHTVCPR